MKTKTRFDILDERLKSYGRNDTCQHPIDKVCNLHGFYEWCQECGALRGITPRTKGEWDLPLNKACDSQAKGLNKRS